MAETVPTTRRPARLASTRRCATPRTFSASATDDPPNFITTVSNAMSPGRGAPRSECVTAATQAVSQVLARTVSGGRLAEHAPVVDHGGVPQHPADDVRTLDRADLRPHLRHPVAPEVLQPGADLDGGRVDQLPAERAHRERDDRVRAAIRIAHAQLPRPEVVGV